MRRSRWSSASVVSAMQLSSVEPVLARGTGRLAFEFMATPSGRGGEIAQRAHAGQEEVARRRRRRRTAAGRRGASAGPSARGSEKRRVGGPSGAGKRGCRAADRLRAAGRRTWCRSIHALCTNSNWRAMLAPRQTKCRPVSTGAPAPAERLRRASAAARIRGRAAAARWKRVDATSVVVRARRRRSRACARARDQAVACRPAGRRCAGWRGGRARRPGSAGRGVGVDT